jgi:hypothetical protein
MERRTLLRALGVGVAGISGCAGVQSSGTETTTSETTTAGETTTPGETTTTREEETTTTTDDCPPSAVSDDRTHARSDYGLGIVAEETERPAVTVVGENWRSELRTDPMSEEDESFVEETDFERSVLLVVQYTKSSSGNGLGLTDYEFDGKTLRVELCVVARGGPNDAPTTNLFARLDHSGTVPSTVEARIDRGMETITVSSE